MGCQVNIRGKNEEVFYQDVWVNNNLFARGGRECEFRYFAMRKFFKHFKRPVKVLDIGANMGYFSFRLSQEFPGCYVMVEGAPNVGKGLLRLCKLNRSPSTILLHHRFNLKDLQTMASLEAFDVVLALSIIHHFDEPYKDVFETIQTLGSYLIFEPPVPEEHTLNQDRIIQEPLDMSGLKYKEIVSVPTGSPFRHQTKRPTYLITGVPRPPQKPTFALGTFKTFHGAFPPEDELHFQKHKCFRELEEDDLCLTGSILSAKI